MPDWMKPQEAANYLGVRLDDLVRIINENDVDVDLDEEGNIFAIEAASLREPLFEEHRRKVGHRPDDLKFMEQAKKEHEEKEKREKEARKVKRMRLAKRMKVPRA